MPPRVNHRARQAQTRGAQRQTDVVTQAVIECSDSSEEEETGKSSKKKA